MVLKKASSKNFLPKRTFFVLDLYSNASMASTANRILRDIYFFQIEELN